MAHTGKDHVRTHKEIAVCKPRDPSEETKNFNLRLLDSRTVRNLLFKLPKLCSFCQSSPGRLMKEPIVVYC